MAFSDFRDLFAYKKAFVQAENIFDISISFPKEEKYSLIDQIRRSSRSVCSNLAEVYAKRSYPKHFALKLTDCIGENNETLVWLDFSLKHKYMSNDTYNQCFELNREVGKLLIFMINNPDKFGVNTKE